MYKLLTLSETLSDIAQQGSDSEVQHALELCYAFMERIEQERLGANKPRIELPEYLPQENLRFLN